MEEIALRFDGGEAANGRLHFYEYTRSQYATARFITTIEHFRRTGEIAQRITSKSYVEIFVETPKDGSFLEILLVKAQETAAVAVVAPLASLISLVWATLLPRSEKTESLVLEMAKIRLAEEREKTTQEASRTEQVQSFERMIREGNATTQQALQLVDQAMFSRNSSLDRAGLNQAKLLELRRELTDEQARQELIDKSRAALEGIPYEKLAKLTSRLRPMLPEMALPLNKSANTLSIESGRERKSLILLNPSNVAELVEKELEETTTEIEVHVRSYDRDRGVGKVTASSLPRQLNFAVPPSEQTRLLFPILNAMAQPTVRFICRIYRDKSGEATSLLLENVL